jgi:phosphoribosylamine--glycine ligase
MDILVVGSGGREHALTWALSRSPSIDKLYCAPGNAGIAEVATCWDIPAGNIKAMAAAAVEKQVDLVVIGPEAPLAAGLVDVLSEQGISCFGPSRRAAILESSKAFAKSFMARNQIPTAEFEVFTNANTAAAFVEDSPWGYPLVVKADGLAAGKGAVICEDVEAAREVIQAAMIDQAFGSAGDRVVIEAFMRGTEATCMAFCDGEEALTLLPSQDHKPVFDGDEGPNTGGMGAYAPAGQVLDDAMAERIHNEVILPTIQGMAAEDRRFTGVLYAGMMLTDDGPKVLEFNCRFGDPEAQAILPLLNEDLAERLASIAHGEGIGPELQWTGKSCACVVLASPGYPGKPTTGHQISGLDELAGREDLVIFHAATNRENDNWITAGGRVLGVTGLGDSLDDALGAAYSAIDGIEFEGMHYRRDIGHRETAKKK